MLKVAAKVIDVYDDETGEVAKRLPEEYHSLKVAERSEIETLPDSKFALVMKTADGVLRRRLPVHTADALKLSQAYFNLVKDCLPEEVAKVAEHKLAHPEDVEVAYVDISTMSPRMEKVAFLEQHWGLTIEGKDCFPLHDEVLVKTAVARFPFTVNDLNPEERFLYARNIAKRASALKVEIASDSSINQYTSDTLNLEALKDAIEQRKQAVASTGIGTEVLDQLFMAAGCRPEQGAIETDDSFNLRRGKVASIRKLPVENIIAVLQHFDKLANLNSYHYLRGLADPFAACFKKAEFNPGEGIFVDGVDLSKLSPEMLADRFDQSFISSFAENPIQVYKSLPDPIKAILRELAENASRGVPAKPETPNNSGNVHTPLYGGDPEERLNPALANGNY